MFEEIKAGAVLELDISVPNPFILVWYDKNGEVEYSRWISYDEIKSLIDKIYPEKTFKLHWRYSEDIQIIKGHNIEQAMINAGIGGGALAALDYWEKVKE